MKNYSGKDKIKRIRRPATDWGKKFAIDISKIHEELLKSNKKKTNNTIKK